ncbi:hypothetical protein EIZ39_12325 [Ammoniphilus sp. CFH 90114]|nr:hypothetical protein EIZ39_12325 [Ammoniphilus sp. CFH 90114]
MRRVDEVGSVDQEKIIQIYEDVLCGKLFTQLNYQSYNDALRQLKKEHFYKFSSIKGFVKFINGLRNKK